MTDYTLPPNHTSIGIYPGFSGGVGTGGTGDLHTAVASLETTLGYNLEVISTGLANMMTDPTVIVQRAQGCPQTICWATPLVPLDVSAGHPNSGTLTRLLAGTYDSLIDTTIAKLILYGFGGRNSVLRLGWECTGQGFPWALNYTNPDTGLLNTSSDFISGFNYYVNRARNAGFTGYFDCNGGTHDTRYQDISKWWPGFTAIGDTSNWHSGAQFIGWDSYNSQGGNYAQSDYNSVWNNVAKPEFEKLLAFCRLNPGLRLGIGELGTIYAPQNPYNTNDTALYWQYHQAYFQQHADLIAYFALFNQNSYNSDGSLSQDNQLYYSGNVSAQAANHWVNNSTHGPWMETPSPNKVLSLSSFKQYVKPGNFEFTVPPAPVTSSGQSAAKSRLDVAVW